MKRTAFILLACFFYMTGVIAQKPADSLYVFVGEKINITRLDSNPDNGLVPGAVTYKARYRIVQNVFNQFKQDTIDFDMPDHYGKPPLEKFKYALLYVSVVNGKFIHVTDQFNDVYMTTSGRWAGGYSGYDYNHMYNLKTSIKPVPLQFAQEVSYNVKGKSPDDLAGLYPVPYYKVENNKAYILLGNYVEELFELKKNGVLKERNFFNE